MDCNGPVAPTPITEWADCVLVRSHTIVHALAHKNIKNTHADANAHPLTYSTFSCVYLREIPCVSESCYLHRYFLSVISIPAISSSALLHTALLSSD